MRSYYCRSNLGMYRRFVAQSKYLYSLSILPALKMYNTYYSLRKRVMNSPKTLLNPELSFFKKKLYNSEVPNLAFFLMNDRKYSRNSFGEIL